MSATKILENVKMFLHIYNLLERSFRKTSIFLPRFANDVFLQAFIKVHVFLNFFIQIVLFKKPS